MGIGAGVGAGAGAGAGDGSAATLGALCISTSPPLLLASLLTWLSSSLLLFSLLLLSAADAGVDPSTDDSGRDLGGAVHRGISQTTPVKLLSVKPPLVHFRHGLPDRSSARRPALMAPWLALGPSLCGPRLLRPPSMVPSSLFVPVSMLFGI